MTIKPLSRTQLIAVAGAIAGAFLLYLMLRPAALPVEVGRVARGPLAVTLESEGVTRVIDKYTVSAPVNGRLLRSALQEGEAVTEGMHLASILPSRLNAREYDEASALAASADAAMLEAEARLRLVSSKLAQALIHAKRYDNLYREGAVSKESWEQARTEADVLSREQAAASAAVSAARFRFRAMRSRFDSRISQTPVQVVSPAAGNVLKVYEKSEREVAAGTPLFDIGEPSRIEIVIDVLSSEAVGVVPGQRVLVEGWGGGAPFRATVSRIEPAAFTKVSALGIEEKRVNIIALPDRVEPRLGDNFRIQATILLREAARVLKVPASSLFRSGSTWKLFVIEGGRARERTVRIGLQGTYEAEVLSGVREGDRVVLYPVNDLKPGMRVSVQEK